MHRIFATLILSAGLLAVTAHAQTKQEQIAELVRILGFQEMIDETMSQSTAMSQQVGRQALSKLFSGEKAIDPEKRKRVEDIFARYTERCAILWTSEELVAIWTNAYGSDLTEADLKQMLVYYKSLIGAKDIAAAKKATKAFAATTAEEGQRRLRASLDILIADIKREVAQ